MYCFSFCVPLGSCYKAVPEEQQCIHTHIRVQSCMYVCMYVQDMRLFKLCQEQWGGASAAVAATLHRCQALCALLQL
jgi:hypothetical protein